ncbi:MAG: MFS transporter [Chloroflexota bacterium]|nr:MFS transporter [Chloroflexota bacterium]
MAGISRQLHNDKTHLAEPASLPDIDIKKVGPWILLATILGSSMVFIDSSVVNVALPRLQTDLNATATQVQWVVEAYALFLSALILVGGSLGDSFGRKRIFAIGIALFAAASIGCGFSQNVTQLIATRALQGVGGAMLTPGSLSIIRATFPAHQRGRAIGMWSGFSAITTVLGPLLGGWLVQYATWRWIFFINIPLAIIVLIVLYWRVPDSRNVEGSIHLDWLGALLAIIGLGSLVFGLIESNNLGLSHPLVLGMVALGITALVAFIFVESRLSTPMMPLLLFHSRTFSGTNLLTLMLYAALGGTLFFLPFNLILVQGYSPTAAGAAFLPFTLLLFGLSRWSGGLVNRYGAKLPLVVGPLIAAVGFFLFSLPTIGGSYWTTFFPAVVILGIGMAITIAPLTTTVLGAVDDRYAGIASGINNAVARVAGLLAIAVLSIFVLHAFNSSLDSRLNPLHVSPGVRHLLEAQRNKLAGAQVPAAAHGTLHAAMQHAIAAAFVDSFHLAMWIGVGLALTSALCAFLLVEGRPAPKNQ